MKNFNLKTLLSTYSVAESFVHTKNIRLVRHQMKNWRGFNSMLRFNKHILKVFTAEQGRDIFSDQRLILVFVSQPGGRALLSGAFINNGLIEKSAFEKMEGYAEYAKYRESIEIAEVSSDKFFYDLQVCEELEELFDRLVIDWGGAAISWYQNKLDKEICQILSPGFVKIFPGWDKVNISYQELNAIIQNPDGNPDWAQFLQTHDGVYLILDNVTGRQYVGSATGENAGLWGRWTGYAINGHNGNKLLEELLIERGDSYKENFTFSLHHVFARGAVTKNDVLDYESLLKRKLGSRDFGLNAN